MRAGMHVALAALILSTGAANPPDMAARFGAREGLTDVSLSPDGTKIAFVSPTVGQGAALYTLGLEDGAKAVRALLSSGKPDRMGRCRWVSSDRLACSIYGQVMADGEILPFTREVAVDAGGQGNMKVLSTRDSLYSRGMQLYGGSIVDWLPDENGAVLMSRVYLPTDRTGTHMGSLQEGLAVDRLNTRTLAVSRVEPPERGAIEYISDGRGTVRIKARRAWTGASEMDNGIINYAYRLPGSREWKKLADYNYVTNAGFNPQAVDHDRNVAYGFKNKDGRQALYSIALDGSLKEELIFARPDVDVDELIQIGRRNRVVGASYVTDVRQSVYFDPDLKALSASLGKALPNQPLVRVVDSSVDESKLLLVASSDVDPGTYYILDRKTKQMRPLMDVREEMENLTLGKVRPISYPAADGTMVPGYLTLPPGRENAKGLPAIVLPHGGPGARDEWGFDWLSQYYAVRGFAVLQPNFRGSTGYGDAWFQQNGFRSWQIAVGDVMDAGRWLVKQGIADPAKLGIVGWSYGGYAALQSAVTDPGLFKAVVAIAPVTDLFLLKEQSRNWSNFGIVRDFIGTGPHIQSGSPAQNAGKIKAPVLLFHGTLDRTVALRQSQIMASRLKDAGGQVDLVTWDGLDHYLDDSAARTELLRRSDGFLRTAMGVKP
ncbi:MAG: peptidase prolyl oligopeptidase active site domain protein [Sphingomonas bacterium]|nr:S9 family peptidase [Sphingomonas bacterium]MDB5689352.1 peptidase prolyl oligopeptidase active site domain protein [Sphingomonas bacterium]